jgi:hypothetical protein
MECIEYTKQYLIQQNENVDEYFITIFQLQQTIEQKQNQQITKASTNEIETSTSSTLVFRLWHENVFVGARSSAVGNPGEKCRDLYFHIDTGKFIGMYTLEYTDELMNKLDPTQTTLEQQQTTQTKHSEVE